jgi:Domain of unknown function (DUF4307)
MTQVSTQAPQERYGRSADERADHKLKIIGAVLGVFLLGGVAWYGYNAVADQSVSAEIITYKQLPHNEIQIRIEGHKGAGVQGSCTVRATDTDHDEVGRKTVQYDEKTTDIDSTIMLHTTGKATSTELVGCSDS